MQCVNLNNAHKIKALMFKFFVIIILFLTSCISVAAQEQSIQLQLLNGGYNDNNEKVIMGLEIKTPKGWHSYWKSPGEGGLPPEFKIEKSDNTSSMEVLWPTPQEINFNGVRTIGYEEKVVLPFYITPTDQDKDVTLILDARVYACLNYCTSFEESFELVIPPGYQSLLRQQEISNWLRKVPNTLSMEVTLDNLRQVDKGEFIVNYSSFEPITPNLFIATKDNVPFTVQKPSKPEKSGQIRFSSDQNSLTNSSSFELVLSDGEKSIPKVTISLSWSIMLIALLGGLILNLMPCVFPVLSLKLLALTTGNERQVRTSFAASSFGILISFIFLGCILALMKLAGAQIGWGIQFQSPIFLGVMTALVLAFTLSTAGYFEIILPSPIATKASKLTSGHTIPSSIGQGFVATLLATPCSAPVVGTVVGFALSGTTMDILLIFASMGTGMALPYLLIALIPGIAKLTPKPGPWMNTIKTIFAFALVATAGWLAMLTAIAADIETIYLIPPAIVIFILLPKVTSYQVRPFSLVPYFMVLTFLIPLTADKISAAINSKSEIVWNDFKPNEIQEFVQNGNTVFVYATAEWCITCKVNEKTALADTKVIKALNEIYLMKADWTRPNNEISNFLKSNNRYGIPFSIVYSQSNPQGIILPEILRPSALLNSIQ